jgi:hypothetical protein
VELCTASGSFEPRHGPPLPSMNEESARAFPIPDGGGGSAGGSPRRPDNCVSVSMSPLLLLDIFSRSITAVCANPM